MKAFEELKPVVKQLYRSADAVAPMPVSFEFIWEMLAEAHRAELAQAVREAKQDVYLDIQAWCRLGTTNKQFIRNAVERRLAALTSPKSDNTAEGQQQCIRCSNWLTDYEVEHGHACPKSSRRQWHRQRNYNAGGGEG